MSFNGITISGEELIFDGTQQLQGYFSIGTGKNIDISSNTISLKDSIDVSDINVDNFKIKNQEIAISYTNILIEGQVDLSGNLFFSSGSGIPITSSFGIPFANKCEFISLTSICNKSISVNIPLTLRLHKLTNTSNIFTYDEIIINQQRQYISLYNLFFDKKMSSNDYYHSFSIESNNSITLEPYTSFRMSFCVKLTERY